MRSLVVILFLMLPGFLFSQELNCQVVVNAQQTGKEDMAVFQTLQNSLEEFINQTRWTDREFLPQERIDCSMFINIDSYENGVFSGSIQVQSSRPIYGSTMISPVFNFNDEHLSFEYTEYEPLKYSPNQYTSDLVSVTSFYVYTILGLDADTFDEQGGTPYFEEANQIVNTAQQGNRPGWSLSDGTNTRFKLNADLLSNTFSEYRLALYQYHRQGLDLMHTSPLEGKKGVAEAISLLQEMNQRRPGSLLVRTFFDAKADEVEQIFSGGPSVPIRGIVEALNSMAPTFSEKWGNIRL